MTTLTIAFLVAVAFIILMFKMGINKFVKFGWQTDLVISGILAALFFGTFGGMVVGLIAGIIVSVFLSIAKGFSNLSNPPGE